MNCSSYLRRPCRSIDEVLAQRSLRDYQPDIVYRADRLREARDQAASAMLMGTRMIRDMLVTLQQNRHWRGSIFEMQKARRTAFFAKQANERLLREREMMRETMGRYAG